MIQHRFSRKFVFQNRDIKLKKKSVFHQKTKHERKIYEHDMSTTFFFIDKKRDMFI